MNPVDPSARRSPLSVYQSALAPDLWMVAGALLLACVAALLELAPFWVIWLLGTTALALGWENTPVLSLCLLLPGLVGLRFACQGAVTILGHVAAFRGECRLRHQMVDHIACLAPVRLEGKTGDFKRTIMEDVGRLNGFLAHTLPDLAGGLFLPLASAGLLFAMDWRMALVSLGLLPLMVWAQVRLGAGAAEAFRAWTEADARAARTLLSYVRGVVTLRAFNRQAGSLDSVRQGIHAVRDLAVSITRRSALPYSVFGMTLSYPLAVILPAGLYFYREGSLTLETLLFFLALGAGVMAPLSRVVFALHSLRNIQASGERIRAFLALPPMPHAAPAGACVRPDAPAAVPTGTPTAVPTGEVRFEAVGYTVPTADGTGAGLLSDVTLCLPENSLTLVTGPSGAGKTTLARLLARLDDVSQGAITIGGLDIRSLTPQELAARVSIVFQDPVLFHASVRDNLRLARPNATDDEIREALEAAGAGPMIRAMPEGLETRVGDRGTRLSGGEKQRIALARAFLKNAPVLILDEATAHVDPIAEREIQEAMDRLALGRTVLAIAHRLKAMDRADQVVVLSDGRIEAVGPHATLLEDSPTYRRLWSLQQEASAWSLGTPSPLVTGTRRKEASA
ncbi:ABC transporter ATP-binding protein [Phaeovibrio sulfidiphilus]|uniref:ABC transporter ATP-binding protein n=1 Tax=Phaeovibrio sulfidiphilus TaxID=1220600 RepID=A0A8J7CQ97_9PROT|nr:ABC transporter ATP-binding protein [Phaeovibrio sulfidiphilus]MBE1237997.1 ABC transporter ATP-binding protein [Phaeovibrio sulfidiphilus]